jgi:uncharacterized Fe-S radical SAM superfamily protein PflX
VIPADLDERIARARAAYGACAICERRCGNDRFAAPEAGYCGLGGEAHIFNELLHFGRSSSSSRRTPSTSPAATSAASSA